MVTLELALLLLSAVLVSSVVDQLVPRISLPLVQIALGMLIALAAGSQVVINLDPALFLVLFVAPLLFDEAKNVDKGAMWRHRVPVLSLAIGLVVVTVLVVGFVVNALIPSITLAAAFALGAALGPTDAVAVGSLSKNMDIPARQKDILEAESMLNDASGLVAFQFAIAALTTGAFSLFDASVEFAFAFIGGIVLGGLMGLLVNLVSRKVRDIGLENTTFHVLFEVFTPFIVYLFCNAIGMSGVIAVVAAGLVCSFKNRSAAPSSARMNIVSSSVWRVVSFALNGIVFVLLGTQLPKVMRTSWQDVTIANETLIGYVLGLTLLLYAVRFAWVLALEFVEWRKSDKENGFGKNGFGKNGFGKNGFGKNGELRSCLITTLSGAKGTITLAAVLSAPVWINPAERLLFPQRDLIIFLSCGVILVTLIVATFVVPLLAPRRNRVQEEEEARQRELECQVEILRRVSEELTSRQTSENRVATRAVVRSYNERIERVKKAGGLEDDFEADKLRLQAIRWERDYVTALVDGGGADPWAAYQILSSLAHTERLLAHGAGRWSPQNLYLRVRALLRRGTRALVSELLNAGLAVERMEKKRQLQMDANEYVIEKLRRIVINPESDVPTETAGALLIEYQHSNNLLHSARPSITGITNAASKEIEVRRTAFRLELEQIQAAYEDGLLSRPAAQRLRENVHLMQMDLENSV